MTKWLTLQRDERALPFFEKGDVEKKGGNLAGGGVEIPSFLHFSSDYRSSPGRSILVEETLDRGTKE